MKYIKYSTFVLALLLAGSCDQEVIDLQEPEAVTPTPVCEGATAGSADFEKFVAIGNSFVAGFQAGALFTDGQNNSLAAIMNKQFECVGASAEFNQPTIGASLGWNLFVTQPFLTNTAEPILGRMLLQYGENIDCETEEPSPLPTMQAYLAGDLEALPDPTVNHDFMYTGISSELNNFAVPAVTLGQLLITSTGNWANPNPAVGFTPFYARFASAPGTSRIITDAAAAGGTFFLFWAGLDDFFLYAAYGADGNFAPLTSTTDFATNYATALSPASPIGLLKSNPDLKGVVGNFPDIFKMPHFTSVSYNPIPLTADQVTILSGMNGFGGYNLALTGLIANRVMFGISEELAAEIETRKLTFHEGCDNQILMIDEDLTDLGPYFDGLLGVGAISPAQRAGLAPYEQVRHSGATDVIPLAAGAILGINGTFGVYGVSEPVGDRWVITASEKEEITTARLAYNTAVSNFVEANATRLALADIDGALNTLVINQAAIYNNVTITPNINPPTGIYSEDGVHPNSRGYAFLSRIFIQAINTKFGSTIPLTDIGEYHATALPIP